MNGIYLPGKKLIATKGIYQTRVSPAEWLISTGSRRLKFRYSTPAPGQTSRELLRNRRSIRLDFIPLPSVPVNQVTCHLPEYVMYRINIRATHTVTHGWTCGGRRIFFHLSPMFFPSPLFSLSPSSLPHWPRHPLSSMETAIPHLSLHLLDPKRVKRKLVSSHPGVARYRACVRTHLYALFPDLWSLVRATSTEITTFLLASMEKFESTECPCSTTDGINDNVITVKPGVEHDRNCFQPRDNVILTLHIPYKRCFRFIRSLLKKLYLLYFYQRKKKKKTFHFYP